MSDGALTSLALVLAIAGMGCLALSIGAHWKQLLGDRRQQRSTKIALRSIGALVLAMSFLCCALADPVSMAALVWPLLCMVAAAIVAALLTVQARSSSR
jgi:hypothetical protein